MDYALDKYTNRLVHAEDADQSRRFLCPVCYKEALWKSGPQRRPHFAHWPGEGTEECENYHPSSHERISVEATISASLTLGDQQGRDDTRSGAGSHAALAPLPLYFSRSTQHPLSWRLQIAIPQSFDKEGYVQIEEGIQGLVTLHLSTLIQNGRRVHVRPQKHPYELKTSRQVATSYAEKITMPIPGLKDDKGNVFRYSVRSGARLRDEHPLFWGRTYHIIWHERLSVDFPSHVVHHPFADYPPWKCAEIELPQSQDNSVTLWAVQFLDKRVEKPPVVLTLITPPVTQYTEDEALVVDEEAEVIIGIVGEPGSRIIENLFVKLPTEKEPQYLRLPEAPPLVISLGNLPRGSTMIYFPRQMDEPLRLAVQPSREPASLCGVELVFRERETQQIESLPAFSPLVSSSLQHVQSELKELIDVRLPALIPCHILTRHPGSIVWNDQSFSSYPDDTVETFGRRICAGFSAAIARRNTLIALDFGNYGQPTTLGEVPSHGAHKTFALPHELCKRLEWILSLEHSSLGSCLGPTETLRRLQSLSLYSMKWSIDSKSRRLMQRLLRMRSLPIVVEPHLRALVKEIEKLCGG